MSAPCRVIAVFVAAALPCAWLTAQDAGPALSAAGGQAEGDEADSSTESIASGGVQHRFVGTASCTSANCHGGDGSRPVRAAGDALSPQAYSIWVQRDPHAGAYAVLYNAESQRMAARLGITAHTDDRCLNCHAINAGPGELTRSARHTLHDGVGCEACHGAAEKWLDEHKWERWSARTAAEKGSLGYRDVKDVVARARLCAECHIGSERRDVNHDLIAAGHPRMTFELSAYHANLPKHWQDDGEPGDELDARLWLAGQAVSAESCLAQLARRADDESPVWPEFAEYDCFACHHDLADPSWRQTEFASSGLANPGGLRWGSWHFALLPALLEGGDDAGGIALHELRAEMQQASIRREVVAALAERTSRDLDDFATRAVRQPLGPAERLALIYRLSDFEQGFPMQDWDGAAQRYLGCAALSYAAPTGAGLAAPWDRIRPALDRLRESLQFQQGFQSPRFETPDAETNARAAAREALEEIHQASAPRGD
jgi:hypothetical protein